MSEPEPSPCRFVAGELVEQISLLLPGERPDIAPVIEGIMEIVRGMGCAAGKEDDIETSLREAIASAVRHDDGDGPRAQVEVKVRCDPARGMLVIVRTAGSPFDPTVTPGPILARNLYREHGRGIYLIDERMDEVRLDETGTEIRMVKR